MENIEDFSVSRMFVVKGNIGAIIHQTKSITDTFYYNGQWYLFVACSMTICGEHRIYKLSDELLNTLDKCGYGIAGITER